MAKMDMSERIKEIMPKAKQIRNIGIIAHIHHGKTTLNDNLMAGAGMISSDLAGEIMFTWIDDQERERQLTIYGANVSMVHEYEGNDYLINLMDTPGHVDFGGDVTRAMRSVDGAVVVVCAVEGCMPQTETVLRQALKERVKPIVFVNKVDRMIRELKLTPEQMQKKFLEIIANVNVLIQKYAEKEYLEKWGLPNVDGGSVAFGSAYKNWAISIPYMKKFGISFKEIIDMTNNGQEKELAKKAPLYQVVLDMVVRHLPDPLEAQSYRIPKIWHGDKNSEIYKDMTTCNIKGKMAGVVTKMFPDPHAGFVAAARIFSGRVTKGQEVYLVNQRKVERIQSVSVYKGLQRVPVDEVVAGNIAGIVGLPDAYSGETICDAETPMVAFEEIKHILEPVVTKSIEPENTKDLPKLINILKQLHREDPTIHVKIKEDTGEYLVSGLGELHIESKVERKLREKDIPIKTAKPIVVYKETVEKSSGEIDGKSPNKHNVFTIEVQPLEKSVLELFKQGELGDTEVKKKDLELMKKLTDAGLSKEEAKDVKLIYSKNIFIDATKGIQYLNEAMELVKDGFKSTMDEGPLCKEGAMGLKVILTDASLHEDAIHRGPAQVIPAVRRAIKEGIIKGGGYILEPRQIIRIDTPQDQTGSAIKEAQNRRGQIINIEEELGASVVTAKVPVAEMFGFDSALKSATGGKGYYSLIDVNFEPLPKSLQDNVIKEIRQRKGLSLDTPMV